MAQRVKGPVSSLLCLRLLLWHGGHLWLGTSACHRCGQSKLTWRGQRIESVNFRSKTQNLPDVNSRENILKVIKRTEPPGHVQEQKRSTVCISGVPKKKVSRAETVFKQIMAENYS